MSILQASSKDQHAKYSEDVDYKLRKLETRVQEAEAKTDE